MTDLNQHRMPFVEALIEYKKSHFVPFHTPGHKIGAGAPALLREWMGPALSYDLGVMYALDDLHEPQGALKEAQNLAAQLYGADRCWFSVNGTTALIEAMIMAFTGPGDTVLIPREAHRSVISGLVLSGAKPVYMPCRFDDRWGVPLGVSAEDAIKSMAAHPEAKAVLLVYPNYYGIGVDIESIVAAAHERGIAVLVDEAHGPHFPFSSSLPVEAVAAGADLVAQSTHKSAGSLTQTSMLFGQGPRIDERRVTQMHQMLQSTSPNYLFLASLDMARHQLATEGTILTERAVALAHEVRAALNRIDGIMTMDGYGDLNIDNFDPTKILIDAGGLGLCADEFERLLREERIEVELMQARHVLVLITIGDTRVSAGRLVDAVRRISDDVLRGTRTAERMSFQDENGASDYVRESAILPDPVVRCTPREAMYRPRERIPFERAVHCISGETIAYYPPGIPCVAAGEEITPSVIQYIENRKALGYKPNGAEDMTLQTVAILRE